MPLFLMYTCILFHEPLLDFKVFTSTLMLLCPLYVLQVDPSASYKLAVCIIQNCAEKLEPYFCGFLTACILDRDAVENELKEFYHEIIFELFQCAPQMLLAVIPNLTHELLVCPLSPSMLGHCSSLFFFRW
jgi:hypothetical protein